MRHLIKNTALVVLTAFALSSSIVPGVVGTAEAGKLKKFYKKSKKATKKDAIKADKGIQKGSRHVDQKLRKCGGKNIAVNTGCKVGRKSKRNIDVMGRSIKNTGKRVIGR